MATAYLALPLASTPVEEWVNLRWGGWHLLIAIMYCLVAACVRLQQPKTAWGFVGSWTVTLQAGLVGELYYDIYFLPYYHPWTVPSLTGFWIWGPIEWAVIAFLCLCTETYKWINWKRILLGLIALAPLMVWWILFFNFRVSVCVCAYRLQYMNDSLVNTIEVIWYGIFFPFYLWAMK